MDLLNKLKFELEKEENSLKDIDMSTFTLNKDIEATLQRISDLKLQIQDLENKEDKNNE